MRAWNSGATEQLPFRDRTEAGAVLAEHLKRYRGAHPVVLGIARGGLVVAAEVARRLGAPLDVIVARKLGAPGAPEFAIGAVTAAGSPYLDVEAIRQLGVPPAFVEAETTAQQAQARRQEGLFRAHRGRVLTRHRTAIVVDDGLATGATARAAVRALRAERPAWIVVAAPVGSAAACAALEGEADAVVCPLAPIGFRAVGQYYADFGQTPDAEVQQILAEAGGMGAPALN